MRDHRHLQPPRRAGPALTAGAALEFEPGGASIHLELANALRMQQKGEEAIQEYEEAVRLQPDLQEAHSDLAVTFSSLGRPAEALEHYRKAVEIPPNTAMEHFNLGRCLSATGSPEEALGQFREASRLDWKLPEPLEAAARVLASKPRPTEEEKREAIRLAERAAKLTESPNPLVLETLAMAYAAAGDFERAAGTLEMALESDPHPGSEALFVRLRSRLEELRRAAQGER